MVVTADGRFAGSVSGGCVESAVIAAAAEIVVSQQPQTLSFGVSKEQAWSVGLPCGGRIEVFVAPVAPEIANNCESARIARQSLVLLTELQTGQTTLWPMEGESSSSATTSSRVLAPEVRAEIEQVVAAGKGGLIEQGERRWFVQLLPAPVRLLVVGAAHLSQALASLARCAGYGVTVIDPRTAFAAAERFPGVQIMTNWPDEALAELKPDEQSAVVVLSHDEKLDDPALISALSSPCFYIGALGSQKTQAARRKRLSAAGFDEQALSRVHGPVGLAIGARTPNEIAVAILAEIIQVQRRVSAIH